MAITRNRFLRLALAAAAAPCAAGIAVAEGYPTRPVRVIVPFAPGGPADVLARLLAQQLSQSLGHQVDLENQGGAGG